MCRHRRQSKILTYSTSIVSCWPFPPKRAATLQANQKDHIMTDLSVTDVATGDLQTRSGFAFHVRPVAVGDEAALAEFYGDVSSDDLRFRFFSAVKKVADDQISAMTHVDHRKTEDFIVTEPGKDRIIANAMLAADDKMEVAEVAMSIRSDMKGRGIGWTLLEHVARYAKAKGIKRLQSIESRDNHAAIELEREMGFVAHSVEDEPAIVLLEADLQR
jgi:N-acetylglutamate synthase-like GNAT family acetyltransferase